MTIGKIEMYPVFVLYDDNTHSKEKKVEVPEDIIEESAEIFMKFYKMQDKLEALYRNTSNDV
jgi:hypothetical protein